MTENFLKEAERTLREIEFLRQKNSSLEKQNAVLKGAAEDRGKKIYEQEVKTKELLKIIFEDKKEIEKLKTAIRNISERARSDEYKSKMGEIVSINSELKKHLESAAQKNKEYSEIANSLKKIIIEKNKDLIAKDRKIEELAALLNDGYKIISRLKLEVSSKEDRMRILSGRLLEFTEYQKKNLLNFRENVENYDKEIRKLSMEKREAQVKLTGLFETYSKLKNEFEKTVASLNEQSKKLESFGEAGKNVEELSKKLAEKEHGIEKLSFLAKQSEEKIRNLENLNKQIIMKYEEEKAVLNEVIKIKENELQKIRRIAEKNIKIHEKVVSKPYKTPVPAHFGPVEQREIEAMIKIGLAHGDSAENIEKSLISSGYEKEKIEKVLFRHALL